MSMIANWKENQLNRCKSSPPFYISIEGWRMDNRMRTAVYSIEIGVKTEKDVMIFCSEKRFSALRAVHKGLVKYDDIKPLLQCFPPKKCFGKNEIEFVRKRLSDLKKYFDHISSIPRLSRCSAFNDCFSFLNIEQLWNEEVVHQLEA